MSQMTLSDAQHALSSGDFRGALEALAKVEEHDAAWLEVQANGCYGNGDYEGAVAAWEQLHALHRAAGERESAARAAVMTAVFLLIDAGMLSTVRGWIRRAQRTLADDDDGPLHAMIAAVLGYERFFSGDLVSAAQFAADAIRLGERFDVMPAVAIGRTATARIAVLDGDLDDGLAQLDEVAALLISGEVDDLTTGMMFCELICAAQGLMRADLAREWTDAMARWGVTGAFGGIRGRCRVHQAELLRLSGPCEAAEREALRACEELRPWMRREFGWPLVELGLVRLRRGDLAGAEEAFDGAAEHVWPTHPGRALLALERGDPHSAVRQITDAIAHPIDAPSKELPPFGDLRLAPLFDAQSEISYACGDEVLAAEASHKLAETAARYRSPALAALADLASARCLLLSGDPTSAAAAATAAAAAFSMLEAPFDVGRSRLVLADAQRALGNAAAGTSALAAARDDFARYGADHRVAEIQRRLEHGASEPLVSTTMTVHHGTLRHDRPHWTITLDGVTAHIKDLKGLHYIHRLVTDPGREYHVLDLTATQSGTIGTNRTTRSGIPLLDDAARSAYQRRLADIDDDIDDATSLNDLGRLERAEADRQYLVAELSRAVGLGGRIRHTGDASQRARTAVTRTVRYAIDQLAAEHRPAANHFRASIRTGTYCAYDPDPLATVTWEL